MLTAEPVASANSVWFLVGPFNDSDSVRYIPIHSTQLRIGRRGDLDLTLACETVSNVHAEISEVEGTLVLRDLNSTNGTYVNGQRVRGEVKLREDDLVQFAGMAFRIRAQAGDKNDATVQDNVCDRALALVQFDQLMSQRAVVPAFQPIVVIGSGEVIGYEALARSRVFAMEMPGDMFQAAEQLNLQVELSQMLRSEGVAASRSLPELPHVFVNTHPLELVRPGLIESLRSMREISPDQQITLEIHESAITNIGMMAELRSELSDLGIGLAYDDFGAGQARFNELVEVPPEYLKYDMSLVRDIHTASQQRQQMLQSLLRMTRDLGIIPLAEGIEIKEEAETCEQLGFELAQGYYFGRPASFGDGSDAS